MKKFEHLRNQTQAERTRSAVLEAAEHLFARRGYAHTRLEDVGETVGLTRSALFYHFKDKQTLYEAALEQAFGSLAKRVEDALAADLPPAERLEMAVSALVDAMVERPTLARLILRHIADAEEHPQQRMYPQSDRLFRKGWAVFQEGLKRGEIKPRHDNPFYAASTLIGTTVFYVSALGALLPPNIFDPLKPEHVALHKQDALEAARRLFGIAPKRRSKGRAPKK